MSFITKTIIITSVALLSFTIGVDVGATVDELQGENIIEDKGVLDSCNYNPVYDYSISDLKVYSSLVVCQKWNESEVKAFKEIIHKESSWIHNTEHYENGLSSAFGLGGFLNATWETVDCTKTSDQYRQIECTARYIEQRYNTPSKALKFHNLHNWY